MTDATRLKLMSVSGFKSDRSLLQTIQAIAGRTFHPIMDKNFVTVRSPSSLTFPIQSAIAYGSHLLY